MFTLIERFVPISGKRKQIPASPEPKNTVSTATQEQDVEDLLDRQVEGQIQNVYPNQKPDQKVEQGSGHSPRHRGVAGRWKKPKIVLEPFKQKT